MRSVALALLALTLFPIGITAHKPGDDRQAGAAQAGAMPADLGASLVVPGELVVGLRGQEAAAKREARAAELAAAFDLEVIPSVGLDRIGAAALRVRGATSWASLAARLAAVPDVAYVEPNVVIYPTAAPTDPFYAGVDNVPTDMQRWAFAGLGENRMLNAESAWDVTTGDPSTVIAVLDSGTDTDNPEIRNLWVNRGETPDNGRDDDGNGYVDDVHGYDFVNNRGDINPDLGDGEDNDNIDGPDSTTAHGTQVAAIISAAQNDGIGMAGAAPGCSLMTVKIFGDDEGVGLVRLVDAIVYAADNGAHVMNMSFSSRLNLSSLREAVKYATDKKDVVAVGAAGNGDGPHPQYPGSYENAIAVGGSEGGFKAPENFERVNRRWPLSQYGAAAVDVVAPAKVLTCSVVTVAEANEDPSKTPGDTYYEIVEGTSFATPFVSALAGLVITRDIEIHGQRTLRPLDIKALLGRTAVDLPRGIGGDSWEGQGRVDYAAALAGIPGVAPPAPVAERANYHHRLLRIFGSGFTLESKVEVNGVLLDVPVSFSYAEARLELKGGYRKLNIKKSGNNEIVVIDRGVRSPPLTARFR
jgi:subtilisin family serine protease